jgi:hypothetical protein
MKRKNAILSHRPFKRAGYYTNIEEAMADLSGTPEEKERLAKARMAGLKIIKKVKREGMR